MSIYIIEQSSATFGQTEAGCHVAVGERRVADVISLDAGDYPTTAAANEAAAAFMARWGAYLMVRVENYDYPYTMRVPIEQSLKGLEAARELLSGGKTVETRTPGHTRFALRPESAPSEVLLDKENLAHQRAMLS